MLSTRVLVIDFRERWWRECGITLPPGFVLVRSSGLVTHAVVAPHPQSGVSTMRALQDLIQWRVIREGFQTRVMNTHSTTNGSTGPNGTSWPEWSIVLFEAYDTLVIAHDASSVCHLDATLNCGSPVYTGYILYPPAQGAWERMGDTPPPLLFLHTADR